eukprot:jgi/Hompol1/6462/HPOL_003432-RA
MSQPDTVQAMPPTPMHASVKQLAVSPAPPMHPRSPSAPSAAEALELAVLGDSGVGKSMLAHCFVGHPASMLLRPTRHTDLLFKTFKPSDHLPPVAVKIIDCPGSKDNFARDLAKTNAALLVFDVCDKQSFDHLANWAIMLINACNGSATISSTGLFGSSLVSSQSHSPSSPRKMHLEIPSRVATGGLPHVLVVGNKIDKLAAGQPRSVSRETAQEFAAQNGFFYMEASALDSSTVHEAFQLILSEAYTTTIQPNLPPTSAGGPAETAAGGRTFASTDFDGDNDHDDDEMPSEMLKPRASLRNRRSIAEFVGGIVEGLGPAPISADLRKSPRCAPIDELMFEAASMREDDIQSISSGEIEVEKDLAEVAGEAVQASQAFIV